jgi:hypothetical protein
MKPHPNPSQKERELEGAAFNSKNHFLYKISYLFIFKIPFLFGVSEKKRTEFERGP